MMENKVIHRVENSLKAYINRQKILHELILQIRKDFRPLLDVGQSDEDKKELEDIIPEMTGAIEDLQQQSFEQIRQLLYRIDMSEKVLFDELRNYHQSRHAEIIAWLIAERELKKVITRLYYAGKIKKA